MNDEPSSAAVNATKTVIGSALGLAYLLAADGDSDAVKAKVQIIMNDAAKREALARGNRLEGAVVTWSDLRYLLAGALRQCLAELDRASGSDSISVVDGGERPGGL